jgi:hypothetical protein
LLQIFCGEGFAAKMRSGGAAHEMMARRKTYYYTTGIPRYTGFPYLTKRDKNYFFQPLNCSINSGFP